MTENILLISKSTLFGNVNNSGSIFQLVLTKLNILPLAKFEAEEVRNIYFYKPKNNIKDHHHQNVAFQMRAYQVIVYLISPNKGQIGGHLLV